MHPKSVLITGANRGLGLEFVKQFLQLKTPPTHIFAACRSPDKAEELSKLASKFPAVKLIKLDVGNLDTATIAKKEVEKIVGSDGLNVLVNNAGIYIISQIHEVKPEEMLESYKINVVGPTIITQTFYPLLKQAAKASSEKGQSVSKAAVINVSSGFGSIGRGTPQGFYPYKQSKAALNMTTKLLSNDLKRDEVLVMSVCPGWVQTDMGGSNAQYTPQQSISGILKVLSEVTEKDTGTFRSTDGSVIPW